MYAFASVSKAAILLAALSTFFFSIDANARPIPRSVVVGTELNHGRSLPCREATRRLAMRGLTNVREIDCRRPNYVIRGVRNQQALRVEVRARDGRVVRVDRWHRPHRR